MYKQNIKQAWNLIQQERLFSLLYIIGTGLSISLVMVLSIVFYLKLANIYPETNRDRMLIVKSGSLIDKKQHSTRSSSLALPLIESCFGHLKGVEALAITNDSNHEYYIQPENGKEQFPVETGFVNRDFWTVFPFRFIEGKAFTEADMQSGVPTVVLCQSLAHRLFGEEKGVGKYISLNFRSYRVCGVVQDASQMTEQSYKQVWMPYTACPGFSPTSEWDKSGTLGDFKAYLLVGKASDLSAVKAEAVANVSRYSQTLDEMEFSVNGQPDKQWQTIFRIWSNGTPDFGKELLKWGFIFLIMLLIPAISLSGMADSRMIYASRKWG
ncbi:MAG: ABC transporter permease [Tannerellaceae bacterium]